MTTPDAFIAVNRFGLGPRPGELATVARSAPDWLTSQLNTPIPFRLPDIDLPTSADAAAVLDTYISGRPRPPSVQGPVAVDRAAQVRRLREIHRVARVDVVARFTHGLNTDHGLAERLVYFWSNHFTVAAHKATTIAFAGPFEREAIRPNLTGSFADLLIAATQHPGMLFYLDQVQSTGPASTIGQRRRGGLNENLAREILELHTVGVDAGYDQSDVIELAKALTGWTMATRRNARLVKAAPPGHFAFIDAMHEPGARRVLGVDYPESGVEQGRDILRDLARKPATARHIATKLAGHFVADIPPAALVADLEWVFLETEGDLPSLHRTLVTHDAAGRPGLQKLKTPNEFLLSAMRLTGERTVPMQPLLRAFETLGQVPYRAPSPAGWPDDAASWSGPDAVMKRIEWSQAYSETVLLRQRPEDLASAALGPLLTGSSHDAIRRAESPSQGLLLTLMSPEFQRR